MVLPQFHLLFNQYSPFHNLTTTLRVIFIDNDLILFSESVLFEKLNEIAGGKKSNMI